MEWARRSFRQVKRFSLGEFDDQDNSHPGRERAQTTTACIEESNMRVKVRNKDRTSSVPKFSLIKIKRTHSKRSVKASSGKYKSGKSTTAKEGCKWSSSQESCMLRGCQLDSTGHSSNYSDFMDIFHMIGRDQEYGPMVVTLMMSSQLNKVTLRLPQGSWGISSSIRGSFTEIVGDAFRGLNMSSLYPVVTPDAMKLLSIFDSIYPVLQTTKTCLNDLVKSCDCCYIVSKKESLVKLQKQLRCRTDELIALNEVPPIRIASPPRTPTPSLFPFPKLSPEFFKKLSPFKFMCTSNSPNNEINKESTSFESSFYSPSDDISAVGEDEGIEDDHISVGDKVVENNNFVFDPLSETFDDYMTDLLLQEVQALRIEDRDMKLENEALEDEINAYNKRASKMMEDLNTAKAVITALNAGANVL